MFSFIYDHSNNTEYLQRLAGAMGVQVNANLLRLPEKIGNGYLRTAVLANGVEVLINECSLNDHFNIQRNASGPDHFILRFDELRQFQEFSITVGNTYRACHNNVYTGAFLINTQLPVDYTVNPVSSSRGVSIYFAKDWLLKEFKIQPDDSAWGKILEVNKPAAIFDLLTLEYREMLEDIFSMESSQPLYLASLQNRVLLLMEKFFRNVWLRTVKPETEIQISGSDLNHIIMIEALLANETGETPVPVAELARMAMMSETKLKTLFKKIYHYSLYDYYQRNRMRRARQLIASGKYSVKEVGKKLGFKNLSNFTIAFKKQFNQLPSEIQ